SLQNGNKPWKDKGVYFVTGGNGGLGRIFAREIANSVKEPVIILVGRRELDENGKSFISELKEMNSIVEYITMDITNEESVTDNIQKIVTRYGKINGILHCAGVNYDNYLIKKKEEEICKTLAPKATGVVLLDNATKNLDLDFFICFSSLSGAIGSAGQADYASANAFMDEYCVYRNKLVEEGRRKGVSISINWPLWKDGGMHMDQESEKTLVEISGMVAMPSNQGVKLFYSIWNNVKLDPKFENIICLYGNASDMQVKLIDDLLQLHGEALLSKENTTVENYKDKDIAIIGISGRYPEARNLNQFWDNLQQGKDCISEIPKDRWDNDLYYKNCKKEDIPYLKEGGFLNGVYEFDPLFFSISPNEAKMKDPQERLFLQCCYETLEDAGYTRERLQSMDSSGMSSSVGVFAGAMWEEYQMYGAQEQLLGNPYYMGGNASSIANQVSYFFNLHGPSMVVDTMCSSSLTALHLACQSLHDEECDAALVGGVNLSIHPNKYFLLCQSNFASTRGRCESFGDKGNGYVPGEGVGAVMLKPLKKAVADGDQIYGVIKATAVNHGGKTSSFTVPNPNAQANVIGNVFKKSGINPRTVSYIEAHGTGTKLGDPIEIAGLNQVFTKYTDEKQFCAIGSVKSNIGHLEGAAGIASLTKVLLQMKHKKIVPSLHSSTLNSYIDFENSPFVVSQKLEDWKKPKLNIDGEEKVFPRRACISAFGAGGSNAHVLVEEYLSEEEKLENIKKGTYAITVSARTEEQLDIKIKELYSSIKDNYNSDVFLESIAYILQTGREDFNYRMGFCVSSIQELIGILEKCSNGSYSDKVEKRQVIRNVETVKNLTSKEIQEQIVNGIMKKEQKELLKLWLLGATIPWIQLYSRQNVQKISLPTYPFEKDVYCGIDKMKHFLWDFSDNYEVKKLNIDSNQEKINQKTERSDEAVSIINKNINTVRNTTITEKPKDEFSLLTFEQKWISEPISSKKKESLKIVCFAQDASIMQMISNEAMLFDEKIQLIWILCGEQYEKKSSSEYLIEYEQKEDYVKCFKDIKNSFGSIDNVLYLSPLNDKIFHQEVFGLISILQALYEAKLNSLTVFIAGLYNDLLEKAYAESLIGMDKSVVITHLNLSIGVVLANEKQIDIATYINLLFSECFANTTKSVLYEEGVRKTQKVLPVEVKEEQVACVYENGTYLITGGMGGLGILFAKHLSEQYNANIVLTGRKKLADVEDKLKELKNDGMKVIYVSADVCDEIQIKNLIEETKQTFGEINGIIHSAGLIEGENILDKKYSEYQAIIKPKIQGTLALEKAFAKTKLDFVCYFSSSSAILGDFGSFDYSVGNHFLLSYANYRRQQKEMSGYTYVIEWPLWKDGGMGFKTEAAEHMYLMTSGQKGLTRKEGTQIFDALIKSKQWESLVLYGREERINKMFNIEEKSKETSTTETVRKPIEKDNQKVVKNISSKQSDLGHYVMDTMKELIHSILGVEFQQMDENLNFGDFGFDSVSLSKFAQGIKEFSGVDVTPDVFFEYTSLNEMVNFFKQEHPDALARLYQKEDVVETTDTFVNNTEESYIKETSEHNIVKQCFEDDSIAIVGISGKFPDADNVDEFWDILQEGKEVVRKAPLRFGMENSRAENLYMGVMNNIGDFDPAFFDIPPKEARFMDPRQRILLEETWHALEDAGIGDFEIQNEKIGMFVGADDGDYNEIGRQKGNITSNHNAVLAARLAYFLNLSGPNMCINTACSSGLVAVHQACQSIRTGECDIAIAAGVNLWCTLEGYIEMDEVGMLSASKKCYAFDKRADGAVPAEAVVVVVLKRKSKAEQDSNNIYGEIIASGINYDGKTNGITAPSGKAQKNLLEDVYNRFGVNPSDINYMIAHGTGTRIGDPIEIKAIASVLKNANAEKHSCALTSTKPNIGHTLAASGLVNLIGLVLALKNEMIPKEINCEQPSDYVRWEDSPVYINRENQVWKDGKKLRLGAVSAFGMSGTNAHIVVRSAKKKTEEAITKPTYLVTLSAKTENALITKCSDLKNYLKNKKNAGRMADISFTLMSGRHHFSHRIAFLADSVESAYRILQQIIDGKQMENVFHNEVTKHFVLQEQIQNMIKNLCIESKNETDRDVYWGELQALAQLYCIGYEIPGYEMFEKNSVTKISLPTYPFENEVYWATKEKVKMKKTVNYVPAKKQKQVIKQKTVSVDQYLISDLKDAIYDVLGIPFSQMDEKTNLADFGFTSITLSEFADKISEFSGVDVKPNLFYQYASLNELVSYFTSEHSSALGQLYKVEQASEVEFITEIEEENTEEIEMYEERFIAEIVEDDNTTEKNKTDSVAIVGISGKFPSADNVDELWSILKEGKEVIKEVPPRQGWENRNNCNMQMGTLNCIDEFDPAFFEISPREACFMDPRQRILIEETWHALEDAGIGHFEIQNEKIGMFVGAEDGDYQILGGDKGSITSNHNAVLAARLAYFLNLKGPNMCINTACSSGLVAVHQAYQSIMAGECDIAIAAGVNLWCTPAGYIGMKNAGMISAESKSYTFDKRASGMVPAEAVAVVVLKKMSKAKRDSNNIYGEVIASGINYDGRTNGITAPSGKAQTELLEDVYNRFHINPQDINYIVTHGTGTRIGDPIEIEALSTVFKKANVKTGSCALTSTKPNIGHALAASGVVSLISLVLALKNETIPLEINCEQPSDYVNWDECPFYINNENCVWKDGEKLRVGAVSAFGMSGTNAHIVLKSVKNEVEASTTRPSYLFTLSAKTEKSLMVKCDELLSYLKDKKDTYKLSDLSYTLLDGRQHFSNRIAFVADNTETAIRMLHQIINGKIADNCYKNEVTRSFSPQRKMQKVVKSLCLESRMETNTEEYQDILGALAQYYCMGYDVSGDELFEKGSVLKINIPLYPFENKKYWIPKSQDTISNNEKPMLVENSSQKMRFSKQVVEEQKDKKITKLVDTGVKEVTVPFVENKNIRSGKENSDNRECDLKTQNVKLTPLSKATDFEVKNKKQNKIQLQLSSLVDEKVDGKTFAKREEDVIETNSGTNNKQNVAINIEEITEDLAESLAKELFMAKEDISYDKSFTEMGLDSIVGVEWMRGINKKYNTDIESTKIYQYSTLIDLSQYLYSVLEETCVAKLELPTVNSSLDTEPQSINLVSLSDTSDLKVKDIEKPQKNITLSSVSEKSVPVKTIEKVQPAIKESVVVNTVHTIIVDINIEEIMDDLAESLAKELFMAKEDVSYDKSFTEMGLDSIVGVEWMRGINKKYNTDIESTKIYQYSTLIDLSQYLCSILGKNGEAKVELSTVNDSLDTKSQGINLVSLSDACDFKAEEISEPKKNVSLDSVSEKSVPVKTMEKVQPVIRESVDGNTVRTTVVDISIEEIMDDLADSLAKELFMVKEDVSYDKSFTEMGLDSIVGVEWMRGINNKYHTDIESTQIYKYPNLIDLAKYIYSIFLNDHKVNVQTEYGVQQKGINLVPLPETNNSQKETAEKNNTDERDMVVEQIKSNISQEKIMEELADSLAKELFMAKEDVSYDRSFTEMGLDSIVGVEWMRGINKKYHTDIESTQIYKYPTLIDLSGFLYSVLENNDVLSCENDLDNPICESELDVIKTISIDETKKETHKFSQKDIMEELAESLAKELFMDKEDVSYDRSFTEMGLDSIVGVEWMCGINKRYHTDIESTKIYQYPTIFDLAEYIGNLLKVNENSDIINMELDKLEDNEDSENLDLNSILYKVYQGQIDVDSAVEHIQI
ncbi:MAG: SDR family NAD(P)-dependent oxidoreductase, partial [Acutalibacteraceae bacterium]|nr:SDR family NAD(P)-dependent oxidoreductase [Acutalibacteraceae bacterium]